MKPAIRAAFVSISLSLQLSACAPSLVVPDEAALKQAYTAAIKDAEQIEPDEISTQLTAITPDNPQLVWKQRTGKPHVLMATWTSYDGYDNKPHQTMRLSREVWVTAVPEFRKFCQSVRGDKDLRMEQLLGLPPHSGKNRVVEIWVDPDDLFRPSPDPEINDRKAETDFPASDRFMTNRTKHKAWFNELKASSYGEKGYPWTRLGYTYDWGKKSDNVGLSEFVIAKSAAVEIEGVSTTAQYCQ